MARKSRNNLQPKPADPELLGKMVAKAVADGDLVNLHQIFAPLSPARAETLESIEDAKYAYLRPTEEEEREAAFQKAHLLVRKDAIWQHIQTELEAKRPPRLPWELVMMLGDRAMKLGKPSSAAQAYELLRVRESIKEECYRLAEEALTAGSHAKAAAACLAGLGLEYDYAAFPEPAPATPDFARRALMLHAETPRRPEDSVAFLPPEEFVSTGLTYLFDNPELEERLHGYTLEQRAALFCELVRQRDPEWDAFVEDYRRALAEIQRIDGKLRDLAQQSGGEVQGVMEDMLEEIGEDPRSVPEALLGRAIPDGEWWQYLKELVGRHPPAALFVGRMRAGRSEIITPRLRPDNPVLERLGLDKVLPEPTGGPAAGVLGGSSSSTAPATAS